MVFIRNLWEKKSKANRFRSEQGSNLRGETPLDFKSNALTTRPSLPRRKEEGGDTLVLKLSTRAPDTLVGGAYSLPEARCERRPGLTAQVAVATSLTRRNNKISLK